MSKHDYDLRTTYTETIEPLVDQLTAACKQAGIPCMFKAFVQVDEDKTGVETEVHANREVVPTHFAKYAALLANSPTISEALSIIGYYDSWPRQARVIDKADGFTLEMYEEEAA